MTESELMDKIFDRPGMYIDYPSVIRMECFINGFSFGRGLENEPDPIYRGFTQWVIERRETRGQHPWSAIATMIGGSEEGAFRIARKFWEAYKKSLQDPRDSN